MDDGSGTENGTRHGIREPAHRGDERTVLLGFLQRQRGLVAWKVGGADDDALRSVSTPTGLGAHGVVRHLTNVERSWARDVVAGEWSTGLLRCTDRPARRRTRRAAGASTSLTPAD